MTTTFSPRLKQRRGPVARSGAGIGPSTSRYLHKTIWFKVLFAMCVLLAMDQFDIFNLQVVKQLPNVVVLLMFIHYLLFTPLRMKMPWPATCFGLLLIFAIPGLLYNKYLGMSSSLFTAVFMTMIVICAFRLPERSVRIHPGRILDALQLIGILFVASCILGTLLHERFDFILLVVHEKAFLFSWALLPCLLRRRYLMFGAVAGLSVGLILFDPRTTILVVWAIIFVSAILLRILPVRRIWALGVLLIVVMAVFHQSVYESFKELDYEIKTRSGSRINTRFREVMWLKGVEEFWHSPIVGTGFAGESTYEEKSLDFYGPLHNDYLEFLSKGGIIGGGLMFFGFMGTLLVGLKNMWALKRWGDHELHLLNTVLTIALTCSMFTMAVNPVLNRTRSGFFVYFTVALLLLLNRSIKSSVAGRTRLVRPQRIPKALSYLPRSDKTGRLPEQNRPGT